MSRIHSPTICCPACECREAERLRYSRADHAGESIVDVVVEAIQDLPVFVWMAQAMQRELAGKRPFRSNRDGISEKPPEAPGRVRNEAAPPPPIDDDGPMDLPPLLDQPREQQLIDQAVKNCRRKAAAGEYYSYADELRAVKASGQVDPPPAIVHRAEPVRNALAASQEWRRMKFSRPRATSADLADPKRRALLAAKRSLKTGRPYRVELAALGGD